MLNKKIVVFALLLLVCSVITLTPFIGVVGQDQASAVTITQVSPGKTGPVGTHLLVQGTLYTFNGSYQILFDQTLASSGTSKGYYVSAYANVPELANGTHALTLWDLASNTNATIQFLVTTAYSIIPAPQIQERGSMVLNISVTGGVPNTPYSANVSVSLPNPLNTVYFKTFLLGTSNDKGTIIGQVVYPDSSFQPVGSITDYAGSYTVSFNQSLAQNSFSVGFLDSTLYHRGQIAMLRAAGYQPNQAVNLTISNTVNRATIGSQPLTASADGTIITTWTIPSDARLGDYTVQITPTQGNPKAIPDIESITVTGYTIQVKTINLAGEAVPQINVQALDIASNFITSSKTGSDGIATLTAAGGPQSFIASWNGVKVGQNDLTISSSDSFTIKCTLTNLKITVKNQIGVPMSSVSLAVSYSYKPADTSDFQIGSVTGQTNRAGSFTINSTLPLISYNIEASIYNKVFNAANETFNAIPAQALSEVVITCPNEALTLTVVGYNQAPISGARIELIEETNSLVYTATTNDSGTANNLVTFGTYHVTVYKDKIQINETTIEAFSTSQQEIHCTLFGIEVSVRVVDLLGNGIQKANVTLVGQASERFSALTKVDGTATFSDVVGGNMQILAFAQGSPNNYQAITITVNQPTSVNIKLGQFIALGPLVVLASTLIDIIIVALAIIVLVTLEVYRMKKSHR